MAKTSRWFTLPRLALALLIIVFLSVVTWIGLRQSDIPVTWQDVGYSNVTESGVDIVFDVRKRSADDVVVCTAEALNATYAQVGIRDFTVDPGEGLNYRVEGHIATHGLPVSATVRNCVVQ